MKETEENLLEYSEDEAVNFIFNRLPEEAKKRIDKDTINYVLDVVYDFYDEKGLLDEEDEEVTEGFIDEEELFEYILKAAKKDKINLTGEDIELILDAEFEYGKSIGIYKGEE